MNEVLFYVLGGTLAALAVITSLIGLRSQRFPASAGQMVGVMVVFAALVLGATTFAVRHSADEQEARAAEIRESEAEEGGAKPGNATEGGKKSAEGGESGSTGGQEAGAAAPGAATTLRLAADPTQIAFDTKQLSSKPGKVTIDFTNPAPIEHDVAVEQDGKVIAVSKRITEGKTSVSAELAPGTYTFLCTVPGHAEAGMEGTLTVK